MREKDLVCSVDTRAVLLQGEVVDKLKENKYILQVRFYHALRMGIFRTCKGYMYAGRIREGASKFWTRALSASSGPMRAKHRVCSLSPI